MQFATKCVVYCGFIAGCAVCCKLIIKCAVCRNLLADVANLLRNARFVRFAKDHIRPPRSYGLPQTAANRNNQPQKKIPDEMVNKIKGKATNAPFKKSRLVI